MVDNLTFRSVIKYEQGILLALLSECYAEIWNDKLDKFFGKFDSEVFEHPDTVGACTFITCLGDEVVGFASYDPRKGPELGVVGHNCILPRFQGRGFGRAQINEILRRFRSAGFKKCTVYTGDTSFFEPARKAYEACGFREIKRCAELTEFGWKMVHYEIEL